jgi:hypothetical protein|tara:strand:+ start:65 stop:466 length:402 start_codon:yes stop_codon:yes gene_type:complete
MSFTSYNERDINSFFLGKQQTSPNLGPGYYQPSGEFLELKKKTKSRKPPAFMDGIKPGASTVAVGSNYLNQTFNPGPGKYNCMGTFSPFFSEIIKNKDDETSFFTVQNGGKLTRRTQWFSADRTKRFASDDPS